MKYVLILVCFLQTLVLQGQELKLTAYTPRNGALFSGVNSILQDSDGWMWFTTGYDVVQYDGNGFKIFPPRKGHKMNFCYSLHQIQDEIWVMAEPSMMRVSGDSLELLQVAEPLKNISSSFQVGNATYLLAEGGLWTNDHESIKSIVQMENLQFHHDESLWVWNDTLLITWIFRRSLLVFDIKNKTHTEIALPVTDICKSTTGEIYFLLHEKGIARFNGLDKMNDAIRADLTLIHAIQESKAEFIEIDQQGHFWIGVYEKFLLKIRKDGSTITYTENDGLPGLWFYDLELDREGNLWIGVNSGVAKIANTSSIRFTRDQGLLSNHIAFMIQPERQTDTWIGTYNGMNIVNPLSIRPLLMESDPFTCKHMIESKEQLFYIDHKNLYATRFLKNRDELQEPDLLTPIPGAPLFLEQDRDGNILIATDKGIQVWNGHRIYPLFAHTEHYHCLYVDDHNTLWAGSFAGALQMYQLQYDEGQLSAKQINDALLNSNQELRQIRSITKDKNGILWIGTRYNGLYRISYNGQQIENVKAVMEQDGLQSNSIWGLSCDTSGNIWIASARGLNCLHAGTGSITDEGASAGIYQAAHVFVTAQNQIWVASHPGIILLEKEKRLPVPFSVSIRSVQMQNQSINPGSPDFSKNRFSYNQNQLHFIFSSNSYTDEPSVKYTYRLWRRSKGDWSVPGNLHEVNYPALQPGRYTFEVKAQNINGMWSENTASYSFTIRPPFWMTPWFLLMVAGSLAAGAYLLYTIRIRQLLKLQQIRNNISKDLHDDIGASLSNIHILTTLAQRHITEPQKAGSYLDQAGDDIQQISESLSDIVWNINPQNDDLEHLLSRMKRYAADMMEGNEIHARIEFPEIKNNTPLPMEKRRDFFLIFKEAIHNIIKHSGARTVRIEILDLTDSILLTIQDDGVGFDDTATSEGNGLKNMKLRAAQSDAVLKIHSQRDEGTTITLEMNR